ncbi:MAG: hypothetical protein RJB39_257 [Candidatus Parcubacteria bacterium]|jgi:uncharacterized phage infection (PIP) family protein YhgE
MKTPQDILTLITDDADLSPERDASVRALLADLPADQVVDLSIIDEIQDLIQAQIEEDLAKELTDGDRAEIKTAQDTMNGELAEIEKQIDEDISFVEVELEDLEKLATDLDPVLDQANIDRVKSELKNSSQA